MSRIGFWEVCHMTMQPLLALNNLLVVGLESEEGSNPWFDKIMHAIDNCQNGNHFQEGRRNWIKGCFVLASNQL